MAEKFETEKVSDHWIKNSDQDFKTMFNLFESKDYHWSLFIGHIVIEKLIKASIVKVKNDHAPFTHDLTKLASRRVLSFHNCNWTGSIPSLPLI